MTVWIQFVETQVFTKLLKEHRLEEALRQLQLLLVENLLHGDTDPGTGGLRKVRMASPSQGKGKQGGARVHYLWLPSRNVIYFLFVYLKGDVDRLTSRQKTALRDVVHRIKKEPEPGS